MDPITDLTDARRRLRQLAVATAGKLDEDTTKRLDDAIDSPSIVEAVCGAAELMFARRDQLDKAGRDMVASLALFAGSNAWHGLNVDTRGARIAEALGRAKAADGDPEPLPQYVAAAPATPPAA